MQKPVNVWAPTSLGDGHLVQHDDSTDITIVSFKYYLTLSAFRSRGIA